MKHTIRNTLPRTDGQRARHARIASCILVAALCGCSSDRPSGAGGDAYLSLNSPLPRADLKLKIVVNESPGVPRIAYFINDENAQYDGDGYIALIRAVRRLPDRAIILWDEGGAIIRPEKLSQKREDLPRLAPGTGEVLLTLLAKKGILVLHTNLHEEGFPPK